MILIIGIPNSGKTTYSSQFENVIHFDDVKGTNKQMREWVLDAVQKDNGLCVEGVYADPVDRKKLVEASNEKNTCIWLDTPLDVCLKREQEGRNRSDHLVIWAAEDFKPPTYEEGWDEIITIKPEHTAD